MKIALINGSPKVNGSASAILLEDLKGCILRQREAGKSEGGAKAEKLEGFKKTEIEKEKSGRAKAEIENAEIMEIGLHTAVVTQAVSKELESADAWVFACPLYLDGIPGHLLSCLINLENSSLYNRKILVYGIVNCGFYEGIQAEFALAVMENWCEKSRLIWGGGIGVGGGGALAGISKMKTGQGPKAPIDHSLSGLADKILRREEQENCYVSVAMPRILYKMAAQLGWRQMIRKNGGKAGNLGKQWQ